MEALVGNKGKEYGLIVRGKKAKEQGAKATPIEKSNIFGDESDEDDREFAKKFQNFDSRKETMRAQMKKQTQINLENVLAEDPSVYEYDSIYDSMHADRERKIEGKRDATERKPKYMAKLLKTAEERKLERELQNDRKVQKELEAEGDEFRDKEKFVTASYKKKMAELKGLEERRRQESLVEDAFDVTKQDGLSGFYRFMLHNTGSQRDSEEKSPEQRDRSPLRDNSKEEEKEKRKEDEGREGRRRRKRKSEEEEEEESFEEKREKKRSEEEGSEDEGRERRKRRKESEEGSSEERREKSKEERRKRRKESEEGSSEERREMSKEEKRKGSEEGSSEERREKSKEERRKRRNESEEGSSEERREKSKEERRQRPGVGQTVTERRRREMALAAQAMFSRRADKDAVNAARERYLARRQTRAGPIVEEDSD